MTTLNEPGALGVVSTTIGENGANIDNVSMDEDRSAYTNMHFTLQVIDRQHLARIKRGLRRIPEVVRIARARD